MKNNKGSILGQYTDSKMSKTTKKEKTEQSVPLMATYEQRYKGMVKRVTEPAPVQTLEEKIKSREKTIVKDDVTRVPVVIGGTRYILSTSDDLSANRIHKIANLANSFLEQAKNTNPGLTNSKSAILALIDACDSYISLKNENSNLKTELMYFQQQDMINKAANHVEPTPMEILAEAKGNLE